MNSIFDKYLLLPFLQSIDKYFDRNSFCINEQFYTYQELSKAISKIRTTIKEINLHGKNIGLVANDDLDTYASIFAIWLEGYAYVPLHPLQPLGRSIEIIEQADIEIIIDSSNKTLFKDFKTINTTKLNFSIYDLEVNKISDDAIAYILFTSGSTGKPKGVSISRGNIGSFIKSFFEASFDIGPNDRCLQCFDLTFDVSVQSFLVPLIKGACTYTIPHDQIKYSYVFGLLDDHKLTFGAMAPSMIRYLRPYFDEIDVPSMRYNILTAEASPLDLVEEWAKCIPNAEIYDFYGPTEATIYCTYYKYERLGNSKTLNGMLSIGKAMSGLLAIIIDENGNILDKNQKGELCISGSQITSGYWNNSKKNKESFFDTILKGKQHRFYKTGDSCYFDEDGDIMLSGRLDYQVKIQGYRIELGEIEFHARESLGGINAVAIAFENNTGNTEIALFIEQKTDELFNTVKDYLKSKLPQYMIPTKFFPITPFPLNTNGKVDRNELKKLLK